VEEKERGEMKVIKMCAKMCEFDGNNQPCTRSYHSIYTCIDVILSYLYAIYGHL
jgi:hypothetical protein